MLAEREDGAADPLAAAAVALASTSSDDQSL